MPSDDDYDSNMMTPMDGLKTPHEGINTPYVAGNTVYSEYNNTAFTPNNPYDGGHLSP